MSTVDFQYQAPMSRQFTSVLDSYFTVYWTEQAIELHPGCPDNPEHRVICTCLYYEQATEIARLAANLYKLPVRNFVD